MLQGYRQFYYSYKTENLYEDIADDVEKRFDTSKNEVESNSINRPLPKGKNKK